MYAHTRYACAISVGILAIAAPVYAAIEAGTTSPPTEEGAGSDANDSLIERVVRPDHFEAYRPNYFLFGDKQDQVLFQFSFRYNLWPDDSRVQVFMGYTQRSWWRLYDFEGSSPFAESNYNPELLVRIRYRTSPIVDGFDQLLLGYAHESNGQDGLRSRGWDRLFIEQRFVRFFGPVSLDSPALRVYLRLWWIFATDETNRDIADFAAPGVVIADLSSGTTPAGTFELELMAGKGGYNFDFDRGYLQAGVRWVPPWPDWVRLTPGLYIQGWVGTMQSLERYNISDEAVRVGVFFNG
jgi:phospholipase A1